MAKEITNRDENYSQWYNDIVKKAGLAETVLLEDVWSSSPMVSLFGKI
jgi:hypothetical protein